MNRFITACCAAAIGVAAVVTATAPAHADNPGAVERVAALDVRIPGAATVERLEYSTRNSLGEPVASSGALFLPPGPPPPGGRPIVAWEHGTVGRADACAPSNTDFTFYRPYLENLLAQGYAVAATDYIGLGTPGEHAYLDGRAAAQAAIDMVRAARAAHPALSNSWAAVGHSQGGHAALLTAAIAATYAPELDYRGAVAFAPGASITDTMLLLGRPGTPDILPAGMKTYTAYVLGGVRAARPGFDLDAYLTPLGRRIVADGARLCYDEMTATLDGVSMADMFTRPLAEGDFEAVARPVLDVPRAGYTGPLLIVQGTNDIDVPAPMVWRQAAELRSAGVEFTLRDYPGYDHMQVLDGTHAETNAFLSGLFR